MTEVPESPPHAEMLTVLLRRIEAGDRSAQDELWRLSYRELHRLAERAMRTQRSDVALQSTALIHEVWLRLAPMCGDLRNTDHFLATAARAMRQVLVDAARARRTDKRTPPGRRVPIDYLVVAYEARARDLEGLDRALRELAEADPLMARAVELRFFGGVGVDETARLLGISKRTLERRWTATRAWLAAALS